MYREEKWDSERRLLWIRTTPNGPRVAATMQQTIDNLAERVEWLQARLAERV